LNELDLNRTYCELGYSSLFDYCTHELKYSSDQAYRRIASARLLKKTPEIAQKVEEGKLTLTHLSKANSLFNKIELNKSEKLDILSRLEETSNIACEKIMREISPVKQIQEIIKPVQVNLNEIKFYADDELLGKLSKLKQFLRKDKVEEVIEKLCDDYFIREAKKEKATLTTQSEKENSRYIQASVKRFVLKRAEHRCEFIGVNGKRCEGTYKLEYAHVTPFAHGGRATTANLKLYCKSHNQFDAIVFFGQEKMRPYLSRQK
ncbi:MAG: HNH endonuclease, partial [Bacteriovorax sp.]|nr:HNH endonuclease [Bacteriovorax sp.]